MNITIRNQIFTLHHLGAIYWNDKKTLLISDVHFGKVAHFRKHGIAIPRALLNENYNNLDTLIASFDPEKIIFLGDLFHSILNAEWELFADWTTSIRQEIILIEGNHDVIAKENYLDLDIAVIPELRLDDFLLTHHPVETNGYFNFCGHIHPGVKLFGLGRQHLKLACFFQTANQMILPAFGSFTGKYFIAPTNGNIIYGIADATVFKVKFSEQV
ncbi:ligase-associated DNA damage response endonuclease PdeM [Flavobacterium algicola]|uniref:ligase-associated DNA damage response endonuclease PdeM n=1 Tax=Flavobacterium algicola TaxID=556529 RepID=UPI001EFE920E|nr:ligase-associated DNA damage response endonuclease PdeM [Flavobacterium algicola]MCG9790952.1 ligase-associated DNA damage response endonuclease PdeM [Flavobacterium algicola]